MQNIQVSNQSFKDENFLLTEVVSGNESDIEHTITESKAKKKKKSKNPKKKINQDSSNDKKAPDYNGRGSIDTKGI